MKQEVRGQRAQDADNRSDGRDAKKPGIGGKIAFRRFHMIEMIRGMLKSVS